MTPKHNDSRAEENATHPQEEESSALETADQPSFMMYMPEDGSLSGDTHGPVEGSSSMHHGRKKPRQSSMSSSAFNTSLKQLHFNENRVSLTRAINNTMEILAELVQENQERPVFFPTDGDNLSNLLLNAPTAHLALVRENISLESKSISKAAVDLDDKPDDLALEVEPADFRVLRLNLKMGQNNDVLTTLDKKAVSGLLEQKLNQQIRYLMNLKERVDDTSSKVFVTGDLNAGKSTFCNALLRRKVLPEDQQPCTSIFCEVIDAKAENNGVEEVHAVPIGTTYDKRNEASYIKHPLKNLEDLVYECDKYSLLKVYVLDYRTAEQSLLGNGVIDIKLIDAPGLNMDSYQTTQVFSRQEEIDLVIFVVSAENHFTLSAKEFISAAAAEKRYVFIVVNRFDNIRDKDKCKAKILDQVKNLSPDTYKNAQDFVHFVCSSDIPSDGDGPGGDPDDAHPDFADPNFDHLEASLRKFILDKRSISKLLPAKDFVSNLLGDLKYLAEINQKIYLHEHEKMKELLNQKVGPQYAKMIRESNTGNDRLMRMVERTCTDVYDFTKKEILNTVNDFGTSQVVPYMGLQFAYDYARATQRKMIETIVSSVHMSEQRAKSSTSAAVNEIIEYGKDTLGDEFLEGKVFQPDLMFQRKRDVIQKNLDHPIEFSDFFDPSLESIILWLGIPEEFVLSTRDHVSLYSPSAMMSAIPMSVSAARKNLPTQLTLHTLYLSTKLITTGALIRKGYSLSTYVKPSFVKRIILPVLIGVGGFAVFYLVNDIPNAFPRKQAKKLKSKVLSLDYAHVNADRVARECRQVLNFPTRQVMNNFQSSIDRRNGEKEELEKKIRDSHLSSCYFRSLLEKVNSQATAVQEIDLESIHIVD